MKIVQQDMTELSSGVLFHQVNCRGVMGGGIAYAFARKWPELEEKYRQLCEEFNCDKTRLLGKVWTYGVNKDLVIANVFGQGDVSRSERMTSYDATVNAFERIQRSVARTPNGMFARLPLYFPFKMGCGLGGGDWAIYSAIIDRYFPNAIICQHGA